MNMTARQVTSERQSGQPLPPKRRVRNGNVQRLGYLVVGADGTSIPCAIRDYSQTGATLAASGWMGLPETFSLIIEPDGLRANCRVVRKKGSKVEVVFDDLV